MARTMVSVTYLSSAHDVTFVVNGFLVKFYLLRDTNVKFMILSFEVCKTWNKQIIKNLSYLPLSQPAEIIKSNFITIGRIEGKGGADYFRFGKYIFLKI